MAAVFGLVGYWLVKHDFEPAPMLLGFVLGPLMEENLRRAMLIARGDPTVFITRPISAVLLAIAVLLLVLAALPMIRSSATRCSSKTKGRYARAGIAPARLPHIFATARFAAAAGMLTCE